MRDISTYPIAKKMTCAVQGCGNNKKSLNQGLSFYNVPDRLKRPEQYGLWAEKLNKTNLSSKSTVCSIHFDDGDYFHSSSVNQLMSKKLRRLMLLPGAVPHLNLNLITPKIEKEDHFETIYLPSSSTALFHENSDSEESNASSDRLSPLPPEEHAIPFQEEFYKSRQVQCELGIEKYRRFLGAGYSDECEGASLTEDAPQSRLLSDNSMSEDLAGIISTPYVSLSESQQVQCEMGHEIYRWIIVETQFDGYVCLSGGNCPCKLPKPGSGRRVRKRRNPFQVITGESNSDVKKCDVEKSDVKESNVEKSDGSRSKLEKSNQNKSNVEKSDVKESNVEKRHVKESNVEKSHVKESNVEKSDGDNSECESTIRDSDACTICEKKAKPPADKMTKSKRTRYYPPPKPNFVNLSSPHVREKVASIIHKRGTPNILRRRTNVKTLM